MPTITKPEPHALTRLRERFGLEVTADELHEINRLLADPATKYNTRRFRFVRRMHDTTVWLVNFAAETGGECWVPTVLSDATRRVVTVLPHPVNLSVAETDRLLRDRATTRGRKPSWEERYRGDGFGIRQGRRSDRAGR